MKGEIVVAEEVAKVRGQHYGQVMLFNVETRDQQQQHCNKLGTNWGRIESLLVIYY